MNRRARHTVLLCLFVGLIAFLLLSLSLSDLDLRPGAPIPGAAEATTTMQAATPELIRVVSLAPVLEAILGITLIVLMIYVPARLVSLINLRRLIELLVAIVVVSTLLSILPAVLLQLPTSSATASSPPLSPPSPFVLSLVSSGRLPFYVLWVVAGCFLLGVGLGATRLWRSAYRSSATKEALSRTAENAIRDLGTGLYFSNVIIRCYLQMNQILLREKNLERHYTMTVREFEQWLEYQGIPANPVHQLTSLFEKTRYGDQHVSPADEAAGMECLKQLIQYCQKGKLQGR